jgi:hypothetical protein
VSIFDCPVFAIDLGRWRSFLNFWEKVVAPRTGLRSLRREGKFFAMYANNPASRSSPANETIEVTVICTRDAIDQLADRIERAYRRRHPRLVIVGACLEVWELAATRLLEASVASPNVPIDPELFVAVLATGGNSSDPWTELTPKSSQSRYIKAVRKIIGRLRRELAAELRLAECRIAGGMSLDDLVDDGSDRISSLTRYILAFRTGRFDLVLKHRSAAQRQHRSCPLYRPASRPFLASSTYPCSDFVSDSPSNGQEALQFSLN